MVQNTLLRNKINSKSAENKRQRGNPKSRQSPNALNETTEAEPYTQQKYFLRCNKKWNSSASIQNKEM